MCVVVTKITETRTCCAAAGESDSGGRPELRGANLHVQGGGHEVSSNCSRYKKRSKTTGTNLLYTTNIQKGGVLL